MRHHLSIAALLVVAFMEWCTAAHAETRLASEAGLRGETAAFARLYELGYPADRRTAVVRWRADTGRKGSDTLTAEDVAAVLAQPDPEFFAAFAGNPFEGLGIAVRHKTRSAAETQAAEMCRLQGGGKACREVHVIPGGQCMFVSGYQVRRSTLLPSRGVFAIAPKLDTAQAKSLEMCRKDATAPCKPILSFCADGSALERFGDVDGKTSLR